MEQMPLFLYLHVSFTHDCPLRALGYIAAMIFDFSAGSLSAEHSFSGVFVVIFLAGIGGLILLSAFYIVDYRERRRNHVE